MIEYVTYILIIWNYMKLYGGQNMSKKTAIIISAVLFIVLCALIVCEKMWPTAGTNLLSLAMLR